MTMLFRDDELLITDEWIRSGAGTFGIGEVRQVWVGRGRAGQRSRWTAALALAGGLLVVIGSLGALGWLTRNWVWLLVAPVAFLFIGHIGLLDPIAIYLEKRHHELWISTDTVAVRIYRANAVEANKALRAIHRACERRRESMG
jgi:hypothetical protein